MKVDLNIKSKICTGCKLEKDISEFYITKRKDYLETYAKCKTCWINPSLIKNKIKYSKIPKVESLPKEIWADTHDFEGLYEISNFGRVKSLPKINRPCEKLAKTRIGSSGRVQVMLHKGKIKKYVLVHRLIAYAFIPNIYNKPCINHIDNNPENNLISNLEWCTHQENTNHALKCNRFQLGIKRYNSIFTDNDVLEIFNSNCNQKELAEKYNCSSSAIGMIKTGRNWSHITGKICTRKQLM